MRKTQLLLSKTGLLTAVLILSSPFLSKASGEFASGDGTVGSPYIIKTAEQLKSITLYPDACYQLGNSIDLTEWINANSPQKGWEPACLQEAAPFTGQLDGAGFAITGLWFNRTDRSHIGGLFSWAGSNAVIKNVILEMAPQGIAGGTDVGGMVGRISSGAAKVLIDNCFAKVYVKGTTNCGGIVGYSYTGSVTISNCYVAGQITAKNSNAGGIAGQLWNKADFVVRNCYTTANIISESMDCTGGIIGTLGGPSADKSANVAIENCVALNPSLQISNSSTENLSGRIIGRLVRNNTTGVIKNNLALKEMKLVKGSGNIVPDENAAERNGIAVSIRELVAQTLYSQLGWDFTDTWKMPDNDYRLPVLNRLIADYQPVKLPAELEKLVNAPLIEFGGGDGTEASPYIIKTAVQLQYVAAYPAAHYKLQGDIDLAEWIETNNPETGWTPLCSYAEPFAGIFDGNGFTVTGLWIDMPATNDIGLFSCAGSNAMIKNLGVKASDKGITGKENIGTVVGRIKDGANVEIRNCYAEAGITGNKSCGGILGYSYKGNVLISDCYAGGSVTINTEGAGGIAGYLWNKGIFTIRNCYATNKISATGEGYNIGGLLGIAGGPGTTVSATITIENSVAINPSVFFEATSETAQTRIGRIAGWIKDGTVNATISNNRALSGMKLTRGSETLGAESNASGKDGLSTDAADLTKEELYTDLGWNFISIWNTGNEKYPLPVLSGIKMENQPKVLPEELSGIFGDPSTGIDAVTGNKTDITICTSGGLLIIKNKLPESMVSIFDTTGKQILKTNRSEIEVNNFPKGIYTLTVQNRTLKFLR